MSPKRRKGPETLLARVRVSGVATIILMLGGALLILRPWEQETLSSEEWEEASLEEVGVVDAALDENLPEELSRDEVRDRLSKIAAAVALCGDGQGGVIRVHLKISGKSGFIEEATVAKAFEGTETAKCATGIVDIVQFPRFRKEFTTVVFPFTLNKAPEEGRDGGGDGAITADTPQQEGS